MTPDVTDIKNSTDVLTSGEPVRVEKNNIESGGKPVRAEEENEQYSKIESSSESLVRSMIEFLMLRGWLILK